MSDNAAAQLRRILAVIPELADDVEHPLADVAAKLGVDPATVLKDLESLARRFDEPGGFVESVQLFLTPDTVSVISNHFRRPMRLTVSELRAIELGLAMLRSELPPDERSAVESARDRLLKTLAKLPGDDALEELHYAESGTGSSAAHLSALRAAFRAHQKVDLDYRKGDSEEISSRVVQPYSFVNSSGAWYVVAYCENSEALRIFRLDRIARVAATPATYEIPDTYRVAEAIQGSRALSPGTVKEMKVRYSPRIARWIAEREDGEHEPDGSFTVTHPLADVGWGVRHVLQYGPEAEVLEPAEVRDTIRTTLQRALERL